MDAKTLIKSSLASSESLVNGYLADLTQAELFARPVPGVNHIAWQLGHLIKAEHFFAEQIAPGKVSPLPAGFADAHGKNASTCDEHGKFHTKDEYLALAKKVRGETLAALESCSAEDLDKPLAKAPPFVQNVGQAFIVIGTHWLMHSGQWVVTRRSLGRAPLF